MSVVEYCPMLDACSTEPSTVYTVMKQLQHMMSIMKPRHSVITVDLAIYRVAKKYNNPAWRFHIITNFLGALGTMHNSSGLRQIITLAEVFSDVTTRSIMAGKHYNRGVRLHKLTYEAIYRQKLFAMSEWLVHQDQEVSFLQINLSDVSDPEELTTASEIIAPLILEFDSAISSSSTMAQFWNNYLTGV